MVVVVAVVVVVYVVVVVEPIRQCLHGEADALKR